MKPYIIAEIGSNWTNLSDCLNSVRLAKACGADAVKFQAFTYKDLYGFESETKLPSLPLGWLPSLKEESDRVGIEFMCTAFSVETLCAVDRFVNRHKLASSDLLHIRMLEKLNRIGKPVYMSTGGEKSGTDISAALSKLPNCDKTLMYCVANYPARLVDLRKISQMREAFKVDVGYSDHTVDVTCIPVMAQLQGATAIEKHVNFAEVESVDSPHSLTTKEFKIMCGILTDPNYKFGVSESSFPLRHNRRIVATKNLNRDTVLEEGINFAIARSLSDDREGAHPFLADEMQGKRTLCAIAKGSGISLRDVALN